MSARIKDRLTDLYRDLVDRRLLIPAIALVVAIIAVPIVLKTDSSAPPPPLAPAADVGEATATEAAVLAEQTGIRDYRKRLAALKERNPFESPFAAPDEGAGAGEESLATAIAPPPAGSSESSIGGATPSGDGSSSVSIDVPDTTVSSPPSDGGEPVDVDVQIDEPALTDDPKPEIRFYAPRADVSIGPIGHGKTLEGVRPLELLPDDSSPVVVFVGLAPHGEGAVFNLSPDVIGVSGDGTCAPHKPNPCQFLTLKPGNDVYLKYGLKGTKTYRLKLVDAYAVRVSDPRD